MKYLFIGGSKDGERFEISNLRDYPTICVALPVEPSIAFDNCTRPVDFNAKKELYHRQDISALSTIFTIFVIEGMTIEDAIARIINNYRPINQFVKLTESILSNSLTEKFHTKHDFMTENPQEKNIVRSCDTCTKKKPCNACANSDGPSLPYWTDKD